MAAQQPGQGLPEAPQVPTAAPEPSVRACYGYAWPRLWKDFATLLLVFVVDFAVSIPGWIPCVGPIYSIVVGIPIAFGFSYVYLRAARDEEVRVADLFEGFKNYGHTLLSTLLAGLTVLGGLILLIVPGIIFACKLGFVPYLVVDRKMGAIEAIRTSWRMTTGHAMTIFLMGLLGIPIMIAGLICLIVGVIPALMWVGIASASLYYVVSAKAGATA